MNNPFVIVCHVFFNFLSGNHHLDKSFYGFAKAQRFRVFNDRDFWHFRKLKSHHLDIQLDTRSIITGVIYRPKHDYLGETIWGCNWVTASWSSKYSSDFFPAKILGDGIHLWSSNRHQTPPIPRGSIQGLTCRQTDKLWEELQRKGTIRIYIYI